MNEVVQHFHELNHELEDKMYREQADSIFKCIPMKMELVAHTLHHYTNLKYHSNHSKIPLT